MTMPSQPERHGFFHSLTAQMTLTGIAIVVILLFAWRYVF